MSVKDVVNNLNKKVKGNPLFIKGNISPKYYRLVTNALGMDYPLYGGFPLGRMFVFSGLQHSGKTTGACCVLASYQRKFPDKTCVYVDVEHTLDRQFQAVMNGMDLDKMYYMNPPVGMSGEQICDVILELEKEDDIGLIILDSLPALIPQAVLEKDLTEDAGMRGTMAKKLGVFLPEMQALVSEKQNMFIMINQVRDDGKTYNGIQKYKEPCGFAPQFYSSIAVRFGTRKFTLGDDMDACGSKNGEGADGFRLMFKIMKNKCGACNRGGGFLTYRYATGLDWVNDLLEIALAFGFIQRINNVTYRLNNLETGEVYQDENGKDLQGKKSDLISYIKTNVKFQTEYLAMLNRYISANSQSYGSLLDERTSKEIDEQEALVESQNAYGEEKI